MPQSYLRVLNNVAVEAFTPPGEFKIEDCFTPEVAADFKPAGDAKVGWAWDGAKFTAPAAVAVDFAGMISNKAYLVMDRPYGADPTASQRQTNKRASVNNYLAQLSALKVLGKSTPDQDTDLAALLDASAWEQSVLDARDGFLKTPDAPTWAKASDDASWPPFPANAAAVVATC